jgi:hypothetical protein
MKEQTLDLGEDDNTMSVTAYADGSASFAVCDNGVRNMHFDASPKEVKQILDLLNSLRGWGHTADGTEIPPMPGTP